LLITFKGIFGTTAAPVERWQTSLTVKPNGDFGGTVPTAAQALQIATDAGGSFGVQVMTILQPSCRLIQTDVRFIGDDNKQPKDANGAFIGQAAYNQDVGSTVQGSPYYPYQSAIVASLLTSRAGPTGRGRMYLPAPQYPLGADGLIPAANVASIALRIQALINAVNTSVGVVLPTYDDVSIVSTMGHTTKVTGVRVGRALDTHRSRRGDLLEMPSPIQSIA